MLSTALAIIGMGLTLLSPTSSTPDVGLSSTNNFLSNWTTRTLNNLLKNYDKNIRPDFGLKPTVINTNIHVRSMGPISEQKMLYTFDCYLRQLWNDDRLRFVNEESKIALLQLNERMLRQIWKPDTYFLNGRGSKLHMVTSPNVLFRINSNGDVTYSMRLTIKANCRMVLSKYPMDEQNCSLLIGSHGYELSQVAYRWGGSENIISLADGMKLSQFSLIRTTHERINVTIQNRGIFTILKLNFILQRSKGYFMLQIYLPCSLLVVMSWVGFWINREATADRIALGIMTVLTMVFMGMDNKKDLPRVPYSTALDVYVGVCFAFILATIIEFACVHYFTKVGYGEHYPFMAEGEQFHESIGANIRRRLSQHFPSIMKPEPPNDSQEAASPFHQERSLRFYDESLKTSCLACITGSVEYRKYKRNRSVAQFNSVSRIDEFSRILFPCSFCSFNLAYWILYLYIL